MAARSRVDAPVHGSHHRIGLVSGRRLADYIAANLEWFWESMDVAGIAREEIIARARVDEAALPSNLRTEIRAMAEGSAQPYRELLAFNLYRGAFACDC